MKRIVRRKPFLVIIIATIIVMSAWGTCELTATPTSVDNMYTNDSRVFHHLSVNQNQAIVSIEGDRLFPLGGSYSMCTFINQTPFTAQSTNPLTVITSMAISYKLIAYLGHANIIIEYRLYDADFDELDATIVYSDNILFGIKANTTAITTAKTFEYTSQENQVYYIGVSMRVELSGFASIGGLHDESPAALVLSSLMVII